MDRMMLAGGSSAPITTPPPALQVAGGEDPVDRMLGIETRLKLK